MSVSRVRRRAFEKRRQHLVSGGVPVGFVEVLEVVDVSDEHRGRHADAPSVCGCAVQFLGEPSPVDQSGERIVIGEVAEFLLEAVCAR